MRRLVWGELDGCYCCSDAAQLSAVSSSRCCYDFKLLVLLPLPFSLVRTALSPCAAALARSRALLNCSCSSPQKNGRQLLLPMRSQIATRCSAVLPCAYPLSRPCGTLANPQLTQPPKAQPFQLRRDRTHRPPFVSMRKYDQSKEMYRQGKSSMIKIHLPDAQDASLPSELPNLGILETYRWR